jgi:hypothetical protein
LILPKVSKEAAPMKPLPYFFLSVAVLQALVGIGLGVFMGISGDFTLAPAHAHNNLLG